MIDSLFLLILHTASDILEFDLSRDEIRFWSSTGDNALSSLFINKAACVAIKSSACRLDHCSRVEFLKKR